MDKETLLEILHLVRGKKLSVEDALRRLRHLPYEDIGHSKIDHHRALRQGIPEVIFAAGKTTKEAVSIAKNIYKRQKRFLMTRATHDIYQALGIKDARYYPDCGLITAGGAKTKKGLVVVVSAGTSDRAVSEEAALTAEFLGSRIERLYDAGVAGIHRIFDKRDVLDAANAIVVVAGMEGALPSVIGGLTDKPIIGVPTSVGYGTSLGGLTALFAMLNSCVPGIAVMNIDNGFGAGCLAHKINLASMKKA